MNMTGKRRCRIATRLNGSFTRTNGSTGANGVAKVSGGLLLASNKFYREFTDNPVVTDDFQNLLAAFDASEHDSIFIEVLISMGQFYIRCKIFRRRSLAKGTNSIRSHHLLITKNCKPLNACICVDAKNSEFIV